MTRTRTMIKEKDKTEERTKARVNGSNPASNERPGGGDSGGSNIDRQVWPSLPQPEFLAVLFSQFREFQICITSKKMFVS